MDIDQHESELCEHRESICDGDCGLMIALSDKPTHNCVTALKAHIDEKNRMIETLKAKLQELNNLSQTLNDQLEQLGQQIDENRPISFSPFLSSESSDSVVSDMSDDLNEVSMDVDSMASSDTYENDTGDVDVESFTDNNDRNDRNEALDVVQQVERTVVSSLIDLSSRLERVRNQMRSVLDRGVMDEDNNLNDDVHIPSDALNAIVNNSQNVTSTSGPNTDSSENTSRVEEANTTTGGNSRVYDSHDADERVDSNTRGNEPGTSAAEYSPSYYYSHSDHSDGEWDPDSTNTNTNQNEIPAGTDQRDVTRWSTQRWVRSVLLSPVHIIESQPPRSPSESETSYSSIPSMSSIHSPRLDRTYNENQDVGRSLENGTDNQFRNDNDENSCESFGSQSSVGTVTGHSRSEADNISTGSRDDRDNSNEDDTRHSDTGSFVDHSSGFDNYRGSSIDRSPNHDSDWSRRSSTPKHENENETDREENEEETGDLTDYLEGESRDSSLSDRSNDKAENEDLTFFGGLNDRSSTLDYESDNDHSRSPWSGFSAGFSSQESDVESNCSVKSRSSGNASSPISVQSGSKENDEDNGAFLRKPRICSLKQAADTRFSKKSRENSIWYESDISEKEDGEVRSSDSEGAVSVNASHHISISSEDSEPSDQEHGRRTWKYETKPSTQVNKSTATVTSATAEHDSENSKSKKNKHTSKSSRSITLNKDNNRAKGSSQSKPSTARDVQSTKSSISGKISCNKTITSATSTVQSDNDSRKIHINRKRRQDSECDTENNKRSKYNNSDRSQTQTNQTYRQASPRTDTGNIKVETGIPTQSNQDKNTQSLNVKIDLSLINYTGNILTQSVSQPAPSAGTNIQTNQASVHVRQPNLSSTQQKNTRQTVKTTTNTTSIGSNNALPASKRQLRSVPVKQSENQQGNTRHARSTHSSRYNSTTHETNLSDSTGTLNTSSICSDDECSDSESDKTWEPQGDNESDVSVSEGEPETDTDYEVQIPKTAADLLDEYASDETDDSWTCGAEEVD